VRALDSGDGAGLPVDEFLHVHCCQISQRPVEHGGDIRDDFA